MSRRLNYLTITRPDITFVISLLSQFLDSPCDSHWDAVVRVLRYIKGALRRGLLHENRGHMEICCYTNVDWAGFSSDKRSTLGYFGGNMISRKSKKQFVVLG